MGNEIKPVDLWKPISSAPRDGTVVLLYVPGVKVNVTGGYWQKDYRCWVGSDVRTVRPTHWQPCPSGHPIDLGA